MIIKIAEYECTECWDGVFYKKLSDYPNITEWEIQTVYDFINYEKQNGRACSVEADDSILKKIEEYRKIYDVRHSILIMIVRTSGVGQRKGMNL